MPASFPNRSMAQGDSVSQPYFVRGTLTYHWRYLYDTPSWFNKDVGIVTTGGNLKSSTWNPGWEPLLEKFHPFLVYGKFATTFFIFESRRLF